MLSWSKCSASGCEKQNSRVVVDTNWRWTRDINSSTNCYKGNTWDPKLCPDDKTCTQNCVIEGADYKGTYGVSAEGDALKMGFVTHGPYSTNVGQRMYLLAPGGEGATTTNTTDSKETGGGGGGGNNQNALLPPSKEKYQQFNLINAEFTFDIDVSKLPCGINSALYFVAMDPDGGQKKFKDDTAGAGGGAGYCDAQCSRDLKFVGGTVSRRIES